MEFLEVVKAFNLSIQKCGSNTYQDHFYKAVANSADKLFMHGEHPEFLK